MALVTHENIQSFFFLQKIKDLVMTENINIQTDACMTCSRHQPSPVCRGDELLITALDEESQSSDAVIGHFKQCSERPVKFAFRTAFEDLSRHHPKHRKKLVFREEEHSVQSSLHLIHLQNVPKTH